MTSLDRRDDVSREDAAAACRHCAPAVPGSRSGATVLSGRRLPLTGPWPRLEAGGHLVCGE